jgi:hypothetical protein
MPRSYQAYPQNAIVTHSPANVQTGDPSSAISMGAKTFQLPSALDICAGVTYGTQNPFMSGLNTMGATGGNTSGQPGQFGNMLSGGQYAADNLCGMLSGTPSTGTTPQSMLTGATNVNNAINANPMASGTIAMGQPSGPTGNMAVDGINGVQAFANTLFNILSLCGLCNVVGTPATMTLGNQLGTVEPLTGGSFAANVSPTDIINASQDVADAVTGNPYTPMVLSTFPATGNLAIDAITGGTAATAQNTAQHAKNTSLSSAQSVVLINQNLLVTDAFSDASTIISGANWSFDATQGASSPGSAKCVCNGTQQPMLSSEIAVVLGETVEVACEVQWSGIAYTGSNPIVLAVEKYRKSKSGNFFTYADVGWFDVTTIASPAASSTGWVGIAGTYTVEPGVDQLRFRLEPAAAITAGAVWFDDASFLKLDLIAGECVPATGQTVDNIVTQLYGAAGAGFSQNQAAIALANTAASIASLSAELAALKAEGSTGAIAADDFNWVGVVSANANWTDVSAGGCGPSTGEYKANGTDAAWVAGSSIYGLSCVFEWKGLAATSTTDYQLVQLILDSAPQNAATFENDYSYIRLCGRMNAAGTIYDWAQFGSNGSWAVGYTSGGTATTLQSGTCAVPGLGSTLSFYLGDKASSTLRHFRLEVGSTIIADFAETGSGSPVATTQRQWGWGAVIGSGWFGQATPPDVHQWLAVDQ